MGFVFVPSVTMARGCGVCMGDMLAAEEGNHHQLGHQWASVGASVGTRASLGGKIWPMDVGSMPECMDLMGP